MPTATIDIHQTPMKEMDAQFILELKEQNKKRAQELEEQKTAVYHLEKKLKKASAQEKRDAMREGINDIANIIFSELEYQQELIDELKTDDAEYLQPTHDTLVDLTRIIERCTADDEYPDMIFNLEDDDAQSTQRHEELLFQLDEQSTRLKLQSMRLSMQQSKIDEQTSLISELEVQKRKIASDLEEANEHLAFMRGLQGSTATSQVELGCSELCDEPEKSMKREIHQLNRRLRPLETNLFNKRLNKFCNYLRSGSSISAPDAKVMLHGINRAAQTVDMAEIDARMFEDRVAGLSRDYILDFVRVYGVLPSKILNSSEWTLLFDWDSIANWLSCRCRQTPVRYSGLQ